MSEPENDLLDTEQELVRAVAVMWPADEPMPKVALFGGCTPFEAIGLLRVASQQLERKYAIDDEDEDDYYEDEDED